MQQRVYTRICSFLPEMVERLEGADAPEHIYKWIAFGKTLSDRIVRCILALYVRRPINAEKPGQAASGLTWLRNAEQNIAEKIFYESSQGATLREWIDRHRFSDDFWRETEHRVRLIDLASFFMQIEQRVSAKPRRSNGRIRQPGRVLTQKQRRMLLELLKADGVDVGGVDAGEDTNKGES